jgi:hypothetical protein
LGNIECHVAETEAGGEQDISGNSFLMKCFDSSGILNYAFGGGPMRKIIVLLLVLSISLVVPASTSADEMSPQRDFCSSVGISAGMMMPFGLTCQQWIDPIGFRLMAGGLLPSQQYSLHKMRIHVIIGYG